MGSPYFCKIEIDLHRNIGLGARTFTDDIITIFSKHFLEFVPSFIKGFGFSLSKYGYAMLQPCYLHRWEEFGATFFNKIIPSCNMGNKL